MPFLRSSIKAYKRRFEILPLSFYLLRGDRDRDRDRQFNSIHPLKGPQHPRLSIREDPRNVTCIYLTSSRACRGEPAGKRERQRELHSSKPRNRYLGYVPAVHVLPARPVGNLPTANNPRSRSIKFYICSTQSFLQVQHSFLFFKGMIRCQTEHEMHTHTRPGLLASRQINLPCTLLLVR